MRFNEQTIGDCNLRSSVTCKSLFDVFNYTFTSGGAAALEDLLLDRKESVAAIENMQEASSNPVKTRLH